MDSSDVQVLKNALAWLGEGRRIALATVAQTWGSAPRPPGAWAALRDDGALVGSVSGGCIEDDLVRRMRAGLFAGARPQVLTYGVTKDEAARFGLPCGGTLQLVIETAPDRAKLELLQDRIAAGVVTARSIDTDSGEVMLEDTHGGDAPTWDGRLLTTRHGPPLRLLIIGAGQLSGYLASMAQALDYAVTACDPREEYWPGWQVERAPLLRDMPDDAVLAFKPDRGSAVVALTHDPKLDDLALLEALRSPAFYVGALGSRASAARRRQRLGEHFGMAAAELARLHGPVGLPIGSRTPPEIAVAILAQMIAVRNAAAASAPTATAGAPT